MPLEFLNDLNDNQKIAVLDDSPACLLNAIVGSGKTRVLVSKVIYLNKSLNVSFDDMVVFTFSNKAANEIKERIKEHIPDVIADSIPYMGTFHSVAFKMLKTVLPIEEIGHTKEFSILTPEEEVELAESLIASEKLKIKYINKLSKRIAYAHKGKFLYGTMRYNDDIEKLCNLLEVEKKHQDKMTFDDLIKYALALIPKAVYRPEWVIIDEFQDTNLEQYAFVKTMMDSDTRIFAVGDPNQSIYSFNGGTSKIFDRYIKDFKPNILHLPLNYRSCSNILELARAFSTADNTELKANREIGNKIIVKRQYDQFSEATYISNKIKQLVESGLHYKDIAIFYRMQSLSAVFEDVFTKAGIPFEVSLRKTIADIPALKWLLKVLKASVNVSDNFNAIGMLSDPVFGDNLTLAKAREIIKRYKSTSDEEFPELLIKSNGFRNWCLNGGTVSEIFDYFNLKLNLIPSSIDYSENIENVKLFLNRLQDYITNNNISVFEGISEFVNSAALHGLDILHNGISLNNDSVKLMTLHASKGLEFKQVFIVGINDGLIPIFARTPDEEAEEQRLFFVGITRAKDNLELYYYVNPPERRFRSGKSKYLYWLPDELIIENNYEPSEFNSVALKRGLKAITDNKKQDIESSGNTSKIINNTKYKHPKYGIGKVITQTDVNVWIKFEDIGIKRFSKVFCEQLLEKISENESTSLIAEPIKEESSLRWFKHKKYGKGCLVAETDKDYTVKFEGYGEKKLLKMLCKGLLEEITG